MTTTQIIASLAARATVEDLEHAPSVWSMPACTRPSVHRGVANWVVHLTSGRRFAVRVPAHRDLAFERAAAIAVCVAAEVAR